ncbi:hypothetical protein C8J56DRAFT_926490 [Mycena floridula]|nr:hypothetical protein C8J56DRAFT_926490 [Mycena floridula]
MLATTPTTGFSSFHRPTRDCSMSPSCRPQFPISGRTRYHDSPMLTPSKRQSSARDSEFDAHSSDEFLLQSPFKSPQPQHWSRQTAEVSFSGPPLFAGPAGQSFLITPAKKKPADFFDSMPPPSTPHASSRLMNVGTKRKSATPTSTPLRQHSLTPLKIASTKPSTSRAGGVAFDRLAPPEFTARTPPQPCHDVHMRNQTASLTKLKLTDGWQELLKDEDSGCEMGDEDSVEDIFMDQDFNSRGAPGRMTPFRGKREGEVAEAISPGGHVTKRRAKTRLVSQELLNSANRVNKGSPTSVAFPSSSRRKTSSSCSSPESGSPIPRHRVSGAQRPTQTSNFRPSRAPINRVDSATLFFGPSVSDGVPNSRLRVSTGTLVIPDELKVSSRRKSKRHSYGGEAPSWNTTQHRSGTPQSSPMSAVQGDVDLTATDEEDQDMEFDPIPIDTTFSFSVTAGSPSPRSNKGSPTAIPKKYNPRDSGVVVSDDDDFLGMSSTDNTNTMPQASTSVSSIYSDSDGLVTPGFGPSSSASWPSTAAIVDATDEFGNESASVDAFILRTLAAAAKAPNEEKKAPGTPVKRVKTMAERPWQSAVAVHKVGIDWGKHKVPRKSLPAAFPVRKGAKLPIEGSDSEEDPEESPSNRRNKYPGVGLGRPGFSALSWLSRRSSSGALSSGSDSIGATPSRSQAKGRALQLPRLSVQFSPSKNALRLSPGRSASGSSTSSVMSLGSPSARRHIPTSSGQRPSLPRQFPESPHRGRYERDFVQVEEIGSGEFGKVIKVRVKGGDSGEVFAVKKSRRFEGVKHRLRLTEEVDILQHLSKANNGQRHPNVLGFIDSWEEDDVLYIRTELCELGNLARFLWEYGRAFPRLDEARVWKIIADLSNGLRFIHDSGVIHLDLKPGNIFITGEGRFKIGDFGMASLWPRPMTRGPESFEREGDKLYLAPEVLQGRYSKAADIFSFGMTILEAASNIVVPDQGEAWHRLREEDYSQVDLDQSPELLELIQQLMRKEPSHRPGIHMVYQHPVVGRARASMQRTFAAAQRDGSPVFTASPLAGVNYGFLEEILGHGLQTVASRT